MNCNSQRRVARPVSARSVRIVFLLALLAQILLPSATRAQSEISQEYQVKAAFLYNFARFVDWPAKNFENDQAPMVLCVYGKDPFGSVLDDTVRGKTIGSHSFVVRRLRSSKGLAGCHIAFITDVGTNQLKDVLPTLQESNVLSVGDDSHFAEQGGDIQFVIDRDHVRFVINIDSINRASFRMSSKLLALAKIIHDSK
jgi:uncharacterized protein DUF4154